MPKACVVYGGTEFADSARAVQAYLRGKGFSVFMNDIGFEVSLDSFAAPPGGCDVSVWLSHGGWDGPMIFENDSFGQIDPGETPAQWVKLKAWVQKAIRPKGLLVSHACHSAGSNKYEDTSGTFGDRWVGEVARDMNIYTVGVEGSTASANRYHAVDLLRYALEGRRWIQASRAYVPGGARSTNWRGWLTESK